MSKNIKNIPTGKIVHVLHYTNQGTPESGEIHSIYTTESSALAAMEDELERGFGVPMEENENEDYIYMYISEQYLKK
jgi:hypothetical protein